MAKPPIAYVGLVLSATLVFTKHSAALEPEDGALFVRIVDTGPALCCVIRTDNGTAIVYDCGHWNAQGFRAWKGVNDLFPSGNEIALMVLSHSDSDHLGGASRIFDDYQVSEVVHSGVVRDTTTSENTLERISTEPDCLDIDLGESELPEGTWSYGETKRTFLCGWRTPPDDWPLQTSGEKMNAGSICVRLEFAGKSILLCGDAVGRHLNSPAGTNIATEKYLCDNADELPVDSDLIIAPHHGANNGSCERLIEAVTPDWVIFSAGHEHQHPTAGAAERYTIRGVPIGHMLRTDRGDDEQGGFEWKEGSVQGHVDPPGDDDIDVLIRPDGEMIVEYRFDDFLEAPSEVRSTMVDGVEVQEIVRVHPSQQVPAWVLEAESKSQAEIDALDRPPTKSATCVETSDRDCAPCECKQLSRCCSPKPGLFHLLKARRCR